MKLIAKNGESKVYDGWAFTKDEVRCPDGRTFNPQALSPTELAKAYFESSNGTAHTTETLELRRTPAEATVARFSRRPFLPVDVLGGKHA